MDNKFQLYLQCMCYGKIVRNSHSRVEQFLLESRVITACLRVLRSIRQWFSTFSMKGAKSRSTILWESRTKKFSCQLIHTFCFIADRSLLHKILEVLFTGVARGA